MIEIQALLVIQHYVDQPVSLIEDNICQMARIISMLDGDYGDSLSNPLPEKQPFFANVTHLFCPQD
jgi:hypothetical protein